LCDFSAAFQPTAPRALSRLYFCGTIQCPFSRQNSTSFSYSLYHLVRRNSSDIETIADLLSNLTLQTNPISCSRSWNHIICMNVSLPTTPHRDRDMSCSYLNGTMQWPIFRLNSTNFSYFMFLYLSTGTSVMARKWFRWNGCYEFCYNCLQHSCVPSNLTNQFSTHTLKSKFR
jgi:hypothetical protein